jgi:hypothetical protein
LFEGRNRLSNPITLTPQLQEHVVDIHDGHFPDGQAKRKATRQRELRSGVWRVPTGPTSRKRKRGNRPPLQQTVAATGVLVAVG